MATGYYLLDNRNPYANQYGAKRRNGATVSGVIDIHTTESVPDYVGEDTGAENVARWIATERRDYGSYHMLVDSDSRIPMAPWGYETWHDRLTNNHAIGISIATKAHLWPSKPADWRNRAIRNAAVAAAEAARYVKAETGIDVPARWLTQAEAHARVPGFVRHGTSDPTRRSDPWPVDAPEAETFLAYYAAALVGSTIGTSAPGPVVDPTPAEPTPTPAPEPKAAPYPPLIVDGVRGVVTNRAWQHLLAAINHYKGRIDGDFGKLSTRAEQTWLNGLGHYTGRIDGIRGPLTKKALQRFLAAKGLYTGWIDGDEGPLTVKAGQVYLNNQRQYL